MRRAFFLVLAAGLVGLPAAALGDDPAPEKKKGDEKPVVVPFELLKSRHMAVQVKLNGKGPYRLIFDTGAPLTLINNRIAKDAGVVGTKTAKPAFGMFGMMGQQTVKSLEVGGVKQEDVGVVVMDHPTVTMISEALGPIDGIVGFPFFARYKTTIDYQRKELTLEPSGYKPTDYMQKLMGKIMAGQQKKPEPTVLAAAAVWGFVVDKEAGDEADGVAVKAVMAGGAADAAGLKAGDRLLTLDGRWTDSVADTFYAASRVKPGATAVLVVKRDGKEVKLTAKPTKGV
jgi:hypothetical protein